MKFLRRMYFHCLRYRGEFMFATIFSIIFFLFFGGFYPEDDITSVVEALQQVGIFSGIPPNTAGWSIWMSLMLGILNYVIVTITSINIGSRIIPTSDSDGSEFFMGSTPMDPRQFYLENMGAGLLVVIATMIPGYIIIVVQTLIHDAGDALKNITLAFLAYIILAYFFISLTSVATTSMFQRGLARGVGFGYVFYGMIMELFADSPDTQLQDAAKLSVNYYASITSVLVDDSYSWNPVLVITLLSTLFLIIGILRIKSPHYVEKVTSQDNFSIVDATVGYPVRPHSSFSQRFPLIAEQLRKDKKAIFIMLFIFTIYFPVLLSSFNAIGDELGELAATFNTPSTQMMIQGHMLDASTLGYGILKFYSVAWLWFGILPMLVAASIPTREVLTNSQDILYGTSVKPGKLMDQRLIALLIEFTLIIWFAFTMMTTVSYAIGEEFVNGFVDVKIQFTYFFITWIHYSAIFILVVTVAMIPKEISKGRRAGIAFFVASLLLSWIPYTNENAEFLRFFSVFDYYSPVPLLYGDMSIWEGLLKSGIVLIISSMLYILVRRSRYENASLY